MEIWNFVSKWFKNGSADVKVIVSTGSICCLPGVFPCFFSPLDFYCPFTLYRTVQSIPAEQITVTCLVLALWHYNPRWLVCAAKLWLFSLLWTLNSPIAWSVLSSFFFFFFLRVGFQISVSCLELLWLLVKNILNWGKRQKKCGIKKWKHNCLQFSKQLWLRNVSVHHCQMT